jgi:hypothetical protein
MDNIPYYIDEEDGYPTPKKIIIYVKTTFIKKENNTDIEYSTIYTPITESEEQKYYKIFP